MNAREQALVIWQAIKPTPIRIKRALLFGVCYFTTFYAGLYLQYRLMHLEYDLITPPMVGGVSKRGQLLRHFNEPHHSDTQACYEAFKERDKWEELHENSKIPLRCIREYNPAREYGDFVIHDAEYKLNLDKAINEMRHETAIWSVERGIFKDIVEAKE